MDRGLILNVKNIKMLYFSLKVNNFIFVMI